MVRIQNMRPLPFKLIPLEFFEKVIILSKMDENNFFEKCVLELCRTAMIKPKHIERSGFSYWTTTDKLKFTDWSEIRRNRGFSTEDDDYAPPGIIRVKKMKSHST